MHSLMLLMLVHLLALASAHFNLQYPAARGFDEDNLGKFPCGGQDTVSTNRTAWPTTGGPIALLMGHDRAVVQVLLGLGNDPGSSFQITLQPVITEQGLGSFCMPHVMVPASAGVRSGQNATIQVITNGDPNGGLYNCADITFQDQAPTTTGACKNGTGVSAVPYVGVAKNANETSSQATTPASAPSPTATKSAASVGRPQAAWAVAGSLVGAVTFAALL
ncbi:MAG: hypothetical protein M1826_003423 [Phylliscum demangeonii]|nr:MAG: hypothetical protein M1826_003423 [Phylliscum demangeonii]